MQSEAYDKVSKALEFIAENWEIQPDLKLIASHVEMNEFNFQKLFTSWVGVSPKKFLSVLTLEKAKLRLADGVPMLEASFDVGLSGPGRLHDLFVNYEAMSPGEYKKKAAGITIRYAWHMGVFGETLLFVAERGLCGLAFLDSRGKEECFHDLAQRWPKAIFVEDYEATAPIMAQIFTDQTKKDALHEKAPLKLFLKGTEFQVKVWEALMSLPYGAVSTYGDLAKKLDMPSGASRAIGTAVGMNPISWIIPCHRVIRNTGYLGGYRWGLPRKLAMMGYESLITDGKMN